MLSFVRLLKKPFFVSNDVSLTFSFLAIYVLVSINTFLQHETEFVDISVTELICVFESLG